MQKYLDTAWKLHSAEMLKIRRNRAMEYYIPASRRRGQRDYDAGIAAMANVNRKTEERNHAREKGLQKDAEDRDARRRSETARRRNEWDTRSRQRRWKAMQDQNAASFRRACEAGNRLNDFMGPAYSGLNFPCY